MIVEEREESQQEQCGADYKATHDLGQLRTCYNGNKGKIRDLSKITTFRKQIKF